MIAQLTGALTIIAVCVFIGSYMLGARSQSVRPSELSCVSDEDREAIRHLALQAFDTAFQAHVQLLFASWVKDPASQPDRAMLGMGNAINVWTRSRANALSWSPPVC